MRNWILEEGSLKCDDLKGNMPRYLNYTSGERDHFAKEI